MLEVEDINKIINDELIRHKLFSEDDPCIISIIPDINTFKIIVLVERSYELHLDNNCYLPNAIFTLFNKSSLRDIRLIVPYCRLTSLSGNFILFLSKYLEHCC